MRDKSRAYLRCSAPSETHRFSLSFTTKAGDTGHRAGLSFPGTFRCDFFSAGAPRTSSSPLFLCLRSALGVGGGVRIDVCLWGQGDENKSHPLSQVMCLFSWIHRLVYCVVAFLPSYRLALTGHFSPSNPVHHILVLESVK